MKIIYFAWVKDITNKDFEIMSNISNINDLKKILSETYPKLKKHIDQNILRIAVNKEYVINDINLDQDDEIAIFPPVSGG
tara:strand:+ start:89 stop:328 length:240 start_codon:yes stop_codon:yes gene_type:complete